MLGHAFFPTKKTNKTKQTKTKLNINRDIKIIIYHHFLVGLSHLEPLRFENGGSSVRFCFIIFVRQFDQRLTLSWPNFGSGGPFEVFKKRKMMRIEFLIILAWFQTPQTMFRGSKTPRRPRNINKSKNRSFFERFQGPPWPPWSLLKVTIG